MLVFSKNKRVYQVSVEGMVKLLPDEYSLRKIEKGCYPDLLRDNVIRLSRTSLTSLNSIKQLKGSYLSGYWVHCCTKWWPVSRRHGAAVKKKLKDVGISILKEKEQTNGC